MTIAIVLLSAVQVISGHWVTFYLLWPGGPSLGSRETFIPAMVKLGSFHKVLGLAIGALALVILPTAVWSKSSRYVMACAVVGLGMAALTVAGGILFVTSGFQDRWSLGQMADASVGVSIAFLVQLFFMNATPKFPWSVRTEGKP